MRKLRNLLACLALCVCALYMTGCTDNAIARGSAEDPSQAVYEAGDIVLSDGRTIRPDDLGPEDDPVAVIAVTREDGAILGVGAHISDGCLPWNDGGDPDTRTAFDFALNYAENWGFADNYASGWSLPSIDELSAIYDNREIVNTALESIREQNPASGVEELGTNWYWASTPSDTEEDYAWFVHFFNGYAATCPADMDNLHALCVRVFGEDQ